MKVLSLYCGAGGIDEGLKQLGIKTTLAIDIWSDALKTWKLNHEGEVLQGLVGDLKTTLGYFDIVVGGPPCPPFSQANIKRNNNPIEINHFWDIIDNIIKPKYYLMENVRGVIKVCVREPNYLLNTLDYNVAQSRIRRIFTNVPFIPNPPTRKPLTLRDVLYPINDWETEKELRSKRSTRWFTFRNPLDLDKPSCTITCEHSTHNEYIKNGQYYHKLTYQEMALIQGLPKEYKWYGSLLSRKKQIGNMVPPPLIKSIFKDII